jgi:hypothetical protein
VNRKLELTDEEIQVLDLGVQQALGTTRVELHHTQGFPYKDRIKDRIRLLEQVLAKLEAALKPTTTRTAKEAER